MAGIERVGRLDAAATAYSTIAHQWSDDDASLIGLGNVRYAQQDADGGAAALRAAVRRQPSSAAALNNLAVVLDEPAKTTAALAAAERAVALDRGNRPECARTLSERRADR